ncbi:rieske [2Fe-2S] domain protein [Yokenella regensburgei ATCC 43003]|nr:rieske [2Fe-2S] domain protein [Yokenella regensburgei ATCC 43003]
MFNKFVTSRLDEIVIAFILTVLNKKQCFIYETYSWRIMMSWISVCDAKQVQEDFPFSGNVEGKDIGIYLIDGEYYALEDVCPHAYALLSQGFVEDGKVECPLHEAVFDIKTGKCLHGPGERNLNRYPVRIFENQIQITFIEESVV